MSTNDDLPPDATVIVREIHRRMIALDLNPRSLAVKAGLPIGYFADLFAGRSRNPSTRYMPRIAKALGCTIANLTDPRRPEGDPGPGNGIDKVDEIALLGLWRILDDAGKRRVMNAALREAEVIRGEGADTVT